MGATAKFVLGCWIVVVGLWIIAAFWVKRTRQRQPLACRLTYLAITVAVAIFLNWSFRVYDWNFSIFPHTLGFGILADIVVFLGSLVAIWARVTLGGNWSSRVVLKEDHELIERGPYRMVRHPIYLGLLVMILGTAILAGRVSAFVALLFCFSGFWIKLRQEETLLTEHLPGYPAYKARTKALVPFIL